MVIVPASSGLMGILPSHAPTVAQLRSGVVEVHNGEEKESFFVSSGFAFVHKDRTDLCAVEAVKVSFFCLFCESVRASIINGGCVSHEWTQHVCATRELKVSICSYTDDR